MYIYIYIYIIIHVVIYVCLADVQSKHTSLRAAFKDEVINKNVFTLTHPIFGVVITGNDAIFGLSQMTDFRRRLMKFTFPTSSNRKVRIPACWL